MILMKIKAWCAGMAAALSLVGLSACSTASPESNKLNIVAAFYPFQYVAEQVGGDLVDVTTLTEPGTEPHDLELTAQQIASLSTADLVVYQSDFQTAIDAALEANEPERALDLATAITLLDSDDADGHTDEDEHSDEQHDHADTDPHTWLSPTNMEAFANAVAEQLAEVAPDDADTFAENAGDLVETMANLDGDFASTLEHCETRAFVTSHAAFGYLAHEYDLTQIAIAGIDPNVEPTTARIAEVHSLVEHHGISTIFFETLTSPAVAEALASDLGVETDVLDPVEGITTDSRGDDYVEVMNANLTALAAANGCA